MKLFILNAIITIPVACLIYFTRDKEIWNKYKKIIKKDELRILDISWLSIGIVIIAFAFINLFL